MPRRMNLAIRPVNSIKHVVDVATSTVTAVVSSIPLADATQTAPPANPADVNNGSSIGSIFLRVEVLSTGTFTTVPRIYMAVQKSPGNSIPVVDPNNVGTSDNRRFVIHQEMIMVAEGDSAIPRTMFQGVIRIPPRLKRFGIDDRLVVSFQHGTGETTAITNVCVQCIYKEFR